MRATYCGGSHGRTVLRKLIKSYKKIEWNKLEFEVTFHLVKCVLCFFNWGVINILHFINFRSTTEWFNVCIYCKMITIHSCKNFSFWWKLVRFTLFSSFQICNTVLFTIVTMLYITSPWLIYNWTFITFDPLHLFLLLPLNPSGNHQFILCIYVLFIFKFYRVDLLIQYCDYCLLLFSILFTIKS